MPRQSRVVLPDTPHFITQRGHNRQVIFTDQEEYLYYLENLLEWKAKLKCKVYSFCLLPDHVHLIIDPGGRSEGLGLLMKRLAGRQTRFVNKRRQRTGTLWEGRYKSSPIQASEYLLACCRFIDLHPVRSGLVDTPEQYRWSSYSMKIARASISWLDMDPFYLSLGRSLQQRGQKYYEWLSAPAPDGEKEFIEEASRRGQIIANSQYSDYIFQTTGRDMSLRGPGRPRLRSTG